MPKGPVQPYAIEPRQIVLKNGKQHWKGRVRVFDEMGRRKEINKNFPTKKEAKNWAEKEAALYRDNPHRKPPSDETLEEYLTRWLTIKEASPIERKTLDSYRQMAAHSVRELGTRPLKHLTLLDIQQFYVTLSRQNKSARTVNYVHTVLKMALEDAVEWGLLTQNPAAKAKAKMGRRQNPLRIPTPQEMAQLLRATQGARWYPLWVWFVATGTRLGEALALQWGDIDWTQGKATIQRAVSGDASKRVIKTPKSASGIRTVALGPQLMAVLQNHQREQALWCEVAGEQWQDEDYVFTTRQGKVLSKRNISRAFKQALAAANLPDNIRVHDLRHGMATQWLSKGINPRVVSERLGHSNVAFTLQVYGHVLPHDEAIAAQEMEAETLIPSAESATAKGHHEATDTFENAVTRRDDS